MALVPIPVLSEIHAGIGHIRQGACDAASASVQAFVTSPSVAQSGLHIVQQHIEILEHLVVKLRSVASGIGHMHTRFGRIADLEWHSPAGRAFQMSVDRRQVQAQHLEATAMQTMRLAQRSIEELRMQLAAMQSLLVAARAAVGGTAAAAVGRVCS